MNDRWARWRTPWGAALILAITCVAYLPTMQAYFIWNDLDYVTKPALRGIDGLWRIWLEPGATEQYYPFLHTAFWIEARLWGDSPTGYHVINILQHALAACLLGSVASRLEIPGAWLVACLFALHPVYVESVAWIAEQKNTLSMVFYLAAALVYLRFDKERGKSAYAWAMALFVLAILSKSLTATLPAALLVILWWKRGRLDFRRDALPLVPWFVVGAAVGLFTLWVEHRYIGAHGEDFDLTFLQRTVLSGRIIWFYIWKIFWPAELIFIYPRWKIDATQAWQWTFTIGVMTATAGLWLLRKRTRAPLAAWLFFIGSLFPTLGFLNVYAFKFSYVWDHLQYLPSLGPLVFAGAGIAALLARLPPASRWIGLLVPAAVLATLGALTWRQCGLYHNIESFYRLTLRSNPQAWMASLNLGKFLMDTGRHEEGVAELENTLRIKPNYSKAENNLGTALYQIGRVEEAIPHLEAAVRLDPEFSEAAFNLGLVLRRQGRKEEGLAMLERSSRLTPRVPEVWNAVGYSLEGLGRIDEAIASYERAIELQPPTMDRLNDLGRALSKRGRYQEAAARFEQALWLGTGSVELHYNYGVVLTELGRAEEAISHLEEALRLKPEFPEGRTALAAAMKRAGRN